MADDPKPPDQAPEPAPVAEAVNYTPATPALVAVPAAPIPANETWGQWTRRYIDSWTQWFWQNSDKILLVFLFVYLLGLLNHAAHDQIDATNVHWYREASNTVLGTILGLITGAKIGMAMATKTETKESVKP